MTQEAPYTPQDVADADVAFGIQDISVMPQYSEIPKEFKDDRNPWAQLQSEWFFEGLDSRKLTAKPDVDRTKALRFLTAIQRSWVPQHEHKSAAVAYLLSLWFDLQ
jgi:hypothetical protein